MNDLLTGIMLDHGNGLSSEEGKMLLSNLLDSVHEVLNSWRMLDVAQLGGPLHLVSEHHLTAMETAFDRVVAVIDLGEAG